MRLFLTSNGIGRQNGDDLELLDVPYPDLAALLQDGLSRAAQAGIVATMPLKDATLRAPIQSPRRMFLTGVNYPSHVAETGSTAPEKPPVLVIPVGDDVVVAPHSDITLPAEAATHVDYEGELAVVIGRAGHHIAAGQGWQHVGGYMVVNDVSARDVQMAAFENGKLTKPDAVIRSKSFPTFKPLGPGLTTADELPDISALVLETRVNAELRQRAKLGEMIFDVGQLIEAISQDTALTVGDLILTGTPGGVGFVANNYLKPGDTIDISIDQIGTIHNRVTTH